MAALALGFVGEAIGADIGGTILGVTAASIGGFIGSTIGSFIDNQLFVNPTQGPRLTDLTVQTSTYGNPIPILYGPENRIAGNVIWSSGLIETRHHEHNKFGIVVATTYTYSSSFAVALADCSDGRAAQSIKKIWANGKLVYDATDTSTAPVAAGLWSSITFYPGDFSQTPDPTIEGYEGVGNVPAYRGTCYAVVADLQLADYGNRIPQLDFLVEQDEEITAAAVLTDIVARCGMDVRSVSASAIQGTVRGYAIGSLSSGTAAIQPMALAYNFDVGQVGGGLRFRPRDRGPAGTIPLSHLACHASGDDMPDPISWDRDLETSLPREAALTFEDPDRDYQSNTQTARRQSGSAQSNLSGTIPIVTTAEEGQRIADRMLWEAWIGRATATAHVSDRWTNIEAGQVYVFETPAGYEPLRLKNRTRGANGVIDLELARDRSQVYQSAAAGINASVPTQTVNVPGPSIIMLLDTPILQDSDDNTGFYYAVDGENSGWRGADVLRSQDGGATYDEVAPDGFEAVIGTITSLAAGVTTVFDHANTMRVTLASADDQLESVTETDVLNGKNYAWVGGSDGEDGEVLQFTTASLVSPGVYDCTGLLRGRFGTEYAVGTHSPGETFVLLEPNAIQRADYSASDWNKARKFKAVSLLTEETDATAVDFTNTGEGKRPLSPVHITGLTASGDTTISWTRRSRYRQPGLGNGPLALAESTEAYEIDIFSSSSLARTLTSTSPSVVYTAAMQSTDGTTGDIVIVNVYQMSDTRGRGRPGIAEIQL